ncbi:MAG TPA: class I SAM-dependent methyltransferase [Thermoleophilaceae bacterium]
MSTSVEPVGLPADASLEEARCLFCPEGTSTTRLFEDPPFAVVRCSGCGLVFVSPRIAADQVAGIYGESYWRSPAARDYGYTDYRGDAEHWLRTYRRRAAVLPDELRPGARILDVGCAAGFFLQVMHERGFDVRGVEISASIAAEARARLGDERIHVGDLDDAPHGEGEFDLVSFWDVVEHLPDPIAALQTARRLVASDGWLLVETQNVESRFARLMGRRWQHFKQAEHLWHFSPSTVRRLVEAGGFRVERLTARKAGKYVSLDFIAERATRVHPRLSKVLSPVAGVHGVAPYVNLFDEMIVLARPAHPPRG